jgi:hypothetical protein
VEFDRVTGGHHQGEGGRFGPVESVGLSDDQLYVVVESFGAAVVHPEAEGGEDAVAECGLCRKRRLNPKTRAVRCHPDTARGDSYPTVDKVLGQTGLLTVPAHPFG